MSSHYPLLLDLLLNSGHLNLFFLFFPHKWHLKIPCSVEVTRNLVFCCRSVTLQTYHSYSGNSLFGKGLNTLLQTFYPSLSHHMSTVVFVQSWQHCQVRLSYDLHTKCPHVSSNKWCYFLLTSHRSAPDCVLFIVPLSFVLCIKTSSGQLYSEMVEPVRRTDS